MLYANYELETPQMSNIYLSPLPSYYYKLYSYFSSVYRYPTSSSLMTNPQHFPSPKYPTPFPHRPNSSPKFSKTRSYWHDLRLGIWSIVYFFYDLPSSDNIHYPFSINLRSFSLEASLCFIYDNHLSSLEWTGGSTSALSRVFRCESFKGFRGMPTICSTAASVIRSYLYSLYCRNPIILLWCRLTISFDVQDFFFSFEFSLSSLSFAILPFPSTNLLYFFPSPQTPNYTQYFSTFMHIS